MLQCGREGSALVGLGFCLDVLGIVVTVVGLARRVEAEAERTWACMWSDAEVINVEGCGGKTDVDAESLAFAFKSGMLGKPALRRAPWFDCEGCLGLMSRYFFIVGESGSMNLGGGKIG
jgi:hypothetical protein